jgi:hypothetical protein
VCPPLHVLRVRHGAGIGAGPLGDGLIRCRRGAVEEAVKRGTGDVRESEGTLEWKVPAVETKTDGERGRGHSSGGCRLGNDRP